MFTRVFMEPDTWNTWVITLIKIKFSYSKGEREVENINSKYFLKFNLIRRNVFIITYIL